MLRPGATATYLQRCQQYRELWLALLTWFLGPGIVDDVEDMASGMLVPVVCCTGIMPDQNDYLKPNMHELMMLGHECRS